MGGGRVGLRLAISLVAVGLDVTLIENVVMLQVNLMQWLSVETVQI
jgi:2-polyprenyl-6-methoxyphenol hydroxylase-like FAD-dependent oxidoreductase